MNGIHDMGGMHGFGPVVVETDEPIFHERWEARAAALVSFVIGSPVANIDAFRHAIERLEPADYLSVGYYGRWIRALERLVSEWKDRGEPRGRHATGTLRSVSSERRFSVGDVVRTHNLQPSGHTRLPGYARGKRGSVALAHPGFVFPDTNAERRGENPQWVYAVRFDARELFGSAAEPHASVCIDLFESYLEPEPRDV